MESFKKNFKQFVNCRILLSLFMVNLAVSPLSLADTPEFPCGTFEAAASLGGPGVIACTGPQGCTETSWGIDLNNATGFMWEIESNAMGVVDLYVRLSTPVDSNPSGPIFLDIDGSTMYAIPAEQTVSETGVGVELGPYPVFLIPGINYIEPRLMSPGAIDLDVFYLRFSEACEVPNENNLPIAHDSLLSTAEDTAFSFTVLAEDGDNDPLSYHLVTAPLQGNLTGDWPNLSYTPNANYFGQDTFTFNVHDGSDFSNNATITLDITAVNDAPIAYAQNLTLEEDTTLAITLSGSDIENDSLSYIVETQPANGILSGTAPNLVYTPQENFNGTDSFTFLVNDGVVDSPVATVVLTVTSVNDFPVIELIPDASISEKDSFSYQVSANDIDLPANTDLTYAILSPTLSTITISDQGLIALQASSAVVGQHLITVSVSDQAATVEEHFTLTITEYINQAPSITSSAVTQVNENTLYQYDVDASDPDPNDVLTYALVDNPQGMSIDAVTGLIEWTPVTPAPACPTSPDCVIFRDDFSAVVAGTWVYTDGTSADNNISNGVIELGNGKVVHSLLDVSDYKFSADFNFYNGTYNDAGFIFNYQDINNYYILQLDGSRARLYSWVNGQARSAGSSTAHFTGGTWNTLNAEVRNGILNLYINDIPVFENLSLLLTHGSIGFIPGVPMRYDNIVVSEFKASPPNAIGDHQVTVSASDAEGLSDTQSFTISVLDIENPPRIISQPLEQAEADATYIYDVITEDLDNDSVIVEKVLGPDSLTLTNQLGLSFASWRPSRVDVTQLVPGAIIVDPTCVPHCTLLDIDFTSPSYIEKVKAFSDGIYQWEAKETGLVGGTNFATLETQWPISRFQTMLRFSAEPSNDVGVAFLYLDDNNYYQLEIKNRRFILLQVQDGITTTVASNYGGPSINVGALHTVDIQITDNTVAIYFDDTQVLDSDALAWTNGGIAIRPSGIPIELTALNASYSQASIDDYPSYGIGGHPVEIIATDETGLHSDAQNYLINVQDKNLAPYVLSRPTYTATVGELYTYQAQGADPNLGDQVAYSLDTQTNANFDTATGELDWLPDSAGQFEFTLTVTDLNGLVGTQQFTVNVFENTAPPAFTVAPLDQIIVGNSYQSRVQAVDPDGSPVFYTLENAPPGLSISRHTGHLIWTANLQSGAETSIQVTATDASGQSVTQSFPITVFAPPVITAVLPAAVFAGELFEATITYTDVNLAETHTVDLMTKPDGMNLNPETAEITWQAAFDQEGEHLVTARVTDSQGLFTTRDYTVQVLINGTRPTIISNPMTGVPEHQLYSYDVDAVDPNPNEIIDYSLIKAPAGTSIDSVSGLLKWQTISPAKYVELDFNAFDTGEELSNQYPGVRFAAHDKFGNPRPVYVHQLLDGRYAASDGGYLHSGEAATPGATGSQEIAYDFDVYFDKPIDYFYIRVLDAEEKLVVSAYRQGSLIQQTTRTGGNNDGYDIIFGAVNGEQLYDHIAFDLTSDGSADLLGDGPEYFDNLRYNIVAVEDFTVKATNQQGNYDTQSFSVSVTQDNFHPSITSRAPLAGNVDRAFIYQIIAHDPDADTLQYSMQGAPASLSIDAATGLVTGTPQLDDIGDYTIIFTVEDGRGGEVEQIVTFQITAENQPPVFTTYPVKTALPGQTYIYDFSAFDPEGERIAYGFENLPEGALVDRARGILLWQPSVDNVGAHEITLYAEEYLDAFVYGLRSTQSFTLQVNDGNSAPYFTEIPQSHIRAGETYLAQAKAKDLNDGAILQFALTQAPAGMSIDATTGELSWVTSASDIGQYIIELSVTDEEGASDILAYQLHVLAGPTDNGTAPPVIHSSPETFITSAENYHYQIVASDPNAGDTLSYSLDTAIPNLALNPSTGELSGMLSAGNYHIAIRVTDDSGLYTRQIYTLTVVDDTQDPNVVLDITPANPYVGEEIRVTAQANDNGAIVAASITLNGETLTVIDQGFGTYIAQTLVQNAGQALIDVTVTDTANNTVQLQQSIDVLVDTENPEVVLHVDKTTVGLNETLTFSVSASDNRELASVELIVDGASVALDENNQATITTTVLGQLVATATAIDIDNNSASMEQQVLVADGTDTTKPIAIINSPRMDLPEIVTDSISINATVTDANLLDYELLLSPKGQQQWTRLASGNTELVDSDIATLDPSQLMNGQYDLALVARDNGGNQTTAAATLIVEGDLKVGNFSFTVEDLSIPLVGLPITVSRTYDSRRRHEKLDFGYGWSIDYQNVKVEESRPAGLMWDINEKMTGAFGAFIYHCIDPLGAPVVTVTLPNGDVERFEVAVKDNCNLFVPVLEVELEFVPVGDNQSTLETAQPTTGRLINGDLRTSDGISLLNPDRYILTTKNKYVYHLDQSFGIEKVVDPNGHTITYTDDGIFHSSGKSISFVRNADGLIEKIIDPSDAEITYVRDGANDLENVINRENGTSTYTYNNNHGLVDIFDPLNRKIVKNLYDTEGRLYGQEDGDGNIKYFDHDLDAKTSLVTDRDGRATLFEYDDKGNVLFETQLIADGSYPADIVTAYTYDANNNQESKTIGSSVWSATFNARNDQLSATDPENNTVLYREYSAFDGSRSYEIEEIEDELGRVHKMEYDIAGNLYSVEGPEITDPDTGEVRRPSAGSVINRQGLPTSTTDMRGFTTTFTYYEDGPAKGQKHTESNPVNGTTTYTYDANNNVKTETRERTVNGVVTTETVNYDYDQLDRLVRTTYPDDSYTQTLYDAAGNIDKERDRFGVWMDYDYDVYGRLRHTVYADGSEEIRSYTLEGLLDTVTAQNSTVTRNEYDDAGRLWKVHNDTAGTYTETQYTEQGWVKFEWDENRNLTEYVYDLAGRRESVIRHYKDVNGDPQTQEHSFTYYDNGELHTETDANNHTTTYVINTLDQRVETLYHNNTSMKQRYDDMGARTHTIDQELRVMRFGLDDAGRLSTVTPEVFINGEAVPDTRYAYDEVGNKLTQTDANQNTTTWTYDYFGRVLTRTLPETQQESFTYTSQVCAVQPATTPQGEPAAQCQVIMQTDFNGDTITTVMDSMGRTDTMTYSKDGRVESYSYYPNGQLHTATTPEGVTTYGYDNRNRLEQEDRPDGTTLNYDYDDVGNRTLVQITRNAVVTSKTSYTYDDLNRMETVTNDLNPSDVTTYTYDAVGNLDTVTYANGMVTDYDYNSINQLTDVYTRNSQGAVVGHYHYDLTATGRREVITELSGRTTAYCYDELYRLTGEVIFDSPASPITEGCLTDTTGSDYVANYQYDWTGNRTYETVDGVQTAYTYDDNDRLLQTGGTVYGYDDNGNTLTETLDADVTTYVYDSRNKMTSVTKAGATTNYTYNSSGIRVSKTESGVTTSFIVDENRDYAQVLEEVVGGTAIVSYAYGHDLISQSRNGNNLTYYHYDGLGSTRKLSDAAGVIVKEYDYSAFGSLINESGGQVDNLYLFAGEQFDSALNQYYLRARYYSQQSGRFTSMDLWAGDLRSPITLNKYLYANGDPVLFTDPTGYFSLGSMSSTINNIASLATAAMSGYDIGTALYGHYTGEDPVSFDSASAKQIGFSMLFSVGAGKVLGKIFNKVKNSKLMKKRTLYRGVNQYHPFYNEALSGYVPGKSIAYYPQLLTPGKTAANHNAGSNQASVTSPFTSWTSKRAIAKNNAIRNDYPYSKLGKGVVIKAKIRGFRIFKSPNIMKDITTPWGTHYKHEYEWLVVGPVHGIPKKVGK